MSVIEKRGVNPKSSAKEIVGSHGHRPHGPSILWPALYEHLRAKGYSKEKSARISNAAWNKKHRGQKTNAPTSARGIIKLADVRKLSDRIVYRYQQQNHLEEDVAQITKSELPQAVQDYIDALEDRVAEQTQTITKQAEDMAALEVELSTHEGARLLDNSEDEAIVKAAIEKADPDTAAVLTMLYGEVNKGREKLSKAEQDAQDRELVEKSAQLPAIHVEGEGDVKDILKAAYGVSAEYGEKVFTILKRASDQIEQSDIFKELGSTGAATTVSKSAETFVAELRKENPEMSEEEALATFYSQDGNYEMARPGQEV